MSFVPSILFRFLYPGLIIALCLYLTLDVIKEAKQLQSLSGIICFIAFTYCTSKYPDKVNNTAEKLSWKGMMCTLDVTEALTW